MTAFEYIEYTCRATVIICVAVTICFWIEYLGMDGGEE